MKLHKLLLVIIIGVVVVGLAVYLHSTRPQSNPKSFVEQTTNPIFKNVNESLPQAGWSEETTASEQTAYGNLPGKEEIGKITVDQAYTHHFENPDVLKSLGYNEDLNLAADGPGSSTWGYIKTENGQSQIVLFSYSTIPSSNNPNKPIQFVCPCRVDLKVFISDPFTKPDVE